MKITINIYKSLNRWPVLQSTLLHTTRCWFPDDLHTDVSKWYSSIHSWRRNSCVWSVLSTAQDLSKAPWSLPKVQIILGESAKLALTWPSKAAYLRGGRAGGVGFIMAGLVMIDIEYPRTLQMCGDSPDDYLINERKHMPHFVEDVCKVFSEGEEEMII